AACLLFSEPSGARRGAAASLRRAACLLFSEPSGARRGAAAGLRRAACLVVSEARGAGRGAAAGRRRAACPVVRGAGGGGGGAAPGGGLGWLGRGGGRAGAPRRSGGVHVDAQGAPAAVGLFHQRLVDHQRLAAAGQEPAQDGQPVVGLVVEDAVGEGVRLAL